MTFPELYILRHGETEWNAENRMQGALNSPLTDKGLRDAARQAAILNGLDLTGFQFLCSPQGRAFQTAGLALGRIAADIHTDDRLREIGVGDWSGVLRDGLPVPEGKDPFMAQYEIAPSGEGFARLEVRCRAFLADLTGPSVLVTHGITSRMLRSIVAGEGAVSVPTIHGGQGCVYHLKDGVQKLLE
ncbi:putative phosphoglycerate mutase [Loktanella ponticola]|uniref:Putative phosphoglycerate mutase n=1 Tax=Yoonia ponticola TaxID=1524255 RepID=A0A7W9BJU1_9RHOB|nr:histidine phosphatase family protein [Yoonia ponticola]MBB5721760.1 putative phosphoglycerate mutase [Yoonia ponticola]